MLSLSVKRILVFISVNILIKTGFCQTKTTIGLIAGSGLPDLSIGYFKPNWTLGGVTLLKPLSLGVYGEYTVRKQVKIGIDVTYYRLPLQVSDNLRNPVFKETFTYLNLAPYVAYEPVKWVSVALNLSVRPLLNYSPKEFPPSTALLSYYGPRLTVKPIKQLGIDFGYEIYSRPFATAIGDPASLANTTIYANIRYILFTK